MLPRILPQKYYTKSCLERQIQVNATCDLSGPPHSSHYHFLQEKYCIQHSVSRY